MSVTGGFQEYQKKANVLISHVEQKLSSMNAMLTNENYEGCRVIGDDIQMMLESLLNITDAVNEDELASGQRLQLHRIRCVYCELASHLESSRSRASKEASRHELFSAFDPSAEDQNATTHQLLHSESEGISRSTQAVEHILNQATAGHSSLVSTFNVLERAGGRVRELTANIPLVNNIILSINRKYKRDQIILGSVVAVLLFIIWIFW
eukprot:TRINITY_DN16645_c0_g1_i1.p1 TRINITY_DN16645_c0_g1~~TRINITY_DN16645_c0_g1_i1.p1  ORF type:complete len:209 (+),score=46.00 TRINITY_DN16645_c0_g1_i1:53-679(+)